MLNTTVDVQEKENVAFLKALEDPETKAQIIRLLEEAGLLPLSPRQHD